MLTLTLRPRTERKLKDGNLWVLRDDLSDMPQADPGTLVRVSTSDGASMGTGLYNTKSKIVVRLLGGEVETLDVDFFVERIRAARSLRERFLPNEEGYRVVFGEADFLSGLVVDKYSSWLVLQTMSAGMDQRKDVIVEALRTVFPDVVGIVEKNTAAVRTREGLPLVEGVVWGTVPDVVRFHENDIALDVDLTTGQKTGYFLDQKINRRVVGSLSSGKSVLDCFCNVGGFALNAARGGASHALGIDSSAAAIAAAQHHATINGLHNASFQKANVFDVLRDYAAERRTWDVVVLDPPSFAKNRGALRGALAGYSEINRTALKIVAPGGLLVSSSCTQVVSEHDLMDIILRESARLRRRLRLLHRGEQAPDHPVLLAMPETQYLKFLIFEVGPWS